MALNEAEQAVAGCLSSRVTEIISYSDPLQAWLNQWSDNVEPTTKLFEELRALIDANRNDVLRQSMSVCMQKMNDVIDMVENEQSVNLVKLCTESKKDNSGELHQKESTESLQ